LDADLAVWQELDTVGFIQGNKPVCRDQAAELAFLHLNALHCATNLSGDGRCRPPE
jgi:hypothetical protein